MEPFTRHMLGLYFLLFTGVGYGVLCTPRRTDYCSRLIVVNMNLRRMTEPHPRLVRRLSHRRWVRIHHCSSGFIQRMDHPPPSIRDFSSGKIRDDLPLVCHLQSTSRTTDWLPHSVKRPVIFDSDESAMHYFVHAILKVAIPIHTKVRMPLIQLDW